MLYIDLNILLNIVLAIIAGVFSVLYWNRVGGFMPVAVAVTMFYTAAMLAWVHLVPAQNAEDINFKSQFIGPAFTAIIIIFTYKAIAAYKRVR